MGNKNSGLRKSTEDVVLRFLKYKIVKQHEVTLKDITNDQDNEIRKWFNIYGFRESQDWFKQLSIWIKLGISNFIQRREQLEILGKQKLNLETAILKYGEYEGRKKYEKLYKFNNSNRRNRLEFWLKKGLSKKDAKLEISKEQSKRSRKISEQDKLLWGDKSNREIEKIKILKKLKNRKYKKSGEENTIIQEIIKFNNLNDNQCLYGSRKNQFMVYIENIGKRYYDLAIFSDESLTNLIAIVEYHGLGHVNFSDYSESMKNELMPNIHFKKTYGEAYNNDLLKKKFITDNYPNVQYIVLWREDLKNRNIPIIRRKNEG